MRSYEPKIKKEDLEIGAYYNGHCRNTTIARWNGEVFLYWRNKFGHTFLEEIKCPEDDDYYDVFIAETKLNDVEKEIPLEHK